MPVFMFTFRQNPHFNPYIKHIQSATLYNKMRINCGIFTFLYRSAFNRFLTCFFGVKTLLRSLSQFKIEKKIKFPNPSFTYNGFFPALKGFRLLNKLHERQNILHWSKIRNLQKRKKKRKKEVNLFWPLYI